MVLRRSIRRAAFGAGVALIAMQFVPVARGRAPEGGVALETSPQATELLRRACWDCHSAQTRWPWYARVAPVSWFVAHDVAEGREHLDFSTLGGVPARRRDGLLEEACEEVEKGDMPPRAYRLLHPEAQLSAAERALLREELAPRR